MLVNIGQIADYKNGPRYIANVIAKDPKIQTEWVSFTTNSYFFKLNIWWSDGVFKLSLEQKINQETFMRRLTTPQTHLYPLALIFKVSMTPLILRNFHPKPTNLPTFSVLLSCSQIYFYTWNFYTPPNYFHHSRMRWSSPKLAPKRFRFQPTVISTTHTLSAQLRPISY